MHFMATSERPVAQQDFLGYRNLVILRLQGDCASEHRVYLIVVVLVRLTEQDGRHDIMDIHTELITTCIHLSSCCSGCRHSQASKTAVQPAVWNPNVEARLRSTTPRPGEGDSRRSTALVCSVASVGMLRSGISPPGRALTANRRSLTDSLSVDGPTVSASTTTESSFCRRRLSRRQQLPGQWPVNLCSDAHACREQKVASIKARTASDAQCERTRSDTCWAFGLLSDSLHLLFYFILFLFYLHRRQVDCRPAFLCRRSLKLPNRCNAVKPNCDQNLATEVFILLVVLALCIFSEPRN